MVIFKNKADREVFFRFSFLVAFLVVCIVVVLKVPMIMASVLISIVVAYLMYPLMGRFERWGISRTLGILIAYIAIAGIIFFISQQSYTGLIGQVENFQLEFPKMASRALEHFKQWEGNYAGRYVFLEDLKLVDRFQSYGIDLAQKVFSSMPTFLSSLIAFIVLVPIFTFFHLRDAVKIRKWLLDMLPNRYLEAGSALIYNINRQVEGFIQARLLEAGVLGVCVYVGLMFLGLKYVLFLSLFAAVFNLVPYVGPIIGALPGVAVAYFYADTNSAIWLTIAVYVIAQLIDIVFVIPLVFAKRINIHPMTVIILIFVGSSLMGILGMIIAVPLYGILKAIFQAISTRIVVVQ
jgi:putative permease